MKPTSPANDPIIQMSTDSSCVKGVGYAPQPRVLEMTFPSGDVYQYIGVPPKTYLQLLTAESKGRFYNAEIKRNYPAQWVGGLR